MFKTTKDSIKIEVVTVITKTENSVTYNDSSGRKVSEHRKYFHGTKEAAKLQIIANFDALLLEYQTKTAYIQSQLNAASAIVI